MCIKCVPEILRKMDLFKNEYASQRSSKYTLILVVGFVFEVFASAKVPGLLYRNCRLQS